jgi:hypothetical protein
VAVALETQPWSGPAPQGFQALQTLQDARVERHGEVQNQNEPQEDEEVLDHTNAAVFMGVRVPITRGRVPNFVCNGINSRENRGSTCGTEPAETSANANHRHLFHESPT